MEGSSQITDWGRDFFHYDGLDERPTYTIRLLTILPGASDLITCTLTTAFLFSIPKFKALSYMWGTETPHRTILVNGKSLSVRPNLFEILQRLRRSSREPILNWIDAICVDQENIIERNQQVRLMSTIYSRAELVIAWLGVEEPPGRLEVLNHNPHFIHQFLLHQNSRSLVKRAYDRIGWKSASRQQLDCDMFEVDTALLNLVHRPYWNRAWIVQELFYARDVYVWFGANGEQMFEVLKFWYHSGVPGRSHMSLPILGFPSVYDVKFQPPMSFFQLMWAFRHAQCSDPRDKIYAFLGLARGGKNMISTDIEIDYSKTLEQLCEDVERIYPGYSWLVRANLMGSA
jgi:hypothetical protein